MARNPFYRRPLLAPEIPTELQPLVGVDEQRLRKNTAGRMMNFVRIECPGCGKNRWRGSALVRNQITQHNFTARCHKCSRKFWRLPIVPEEIPDDLHQYLGFRSQKMMAQASGMKTTCIRIVCATCGHSRWMPVSRVRHQQLKSAFTSLCRKCVTGSGPYHPSWKGGRLMTPTGYIKIRKPNHPQADAKGYVAEHRFVMEQHLRHPLMDRQHVHHKNGIRHDNHLENLELWETPRQPYGQRSTEIKHCDSCVCNEPAPTGSPTIIMYQEIEAMCATKSEVTA